MSTQPEYEYTKTSLVGKNKWIWLQVFFGSAKTLIDMKHVEYVRALHINTYQVVGSAVSLLCVDILHYKGVC